MRRPCRACGAPLLFAKTPDGKTIPLDMRSVVYELKDSVEAPIALRATGEVYVTHFQTCTSPDEFSKHRRTQEEA